jgi:CspA family cold shock protein
VRFRTPVYFYTGRPASRARSALKFESLDILDNSGAAAGRARMVQKRPLGMAGPQARHSGWAATREERLTMTGKIRTLRVDKGFGFIKDDKGQEYFFHQSAIYGEGIQDLREGDSVEFDVGQGPKGPRAENVRRTST